MRCGAGTRACRVGTHADACLRHCVTTANRCRDEARHGRHECLRHIGWVECEKCGLTKRALVGGDTEKVALQWANEQVWAGCTGQIAGQERSRFPQYWPFPRICKIFLQFAGAFIERYIEKNAVFTE